MSDTPKNQVSQADLDANEGEDEPLRIERIVPPGLKSQTGIKAGYLAPGPPNRGPNGPRPRGVI